MASQIVYGSLPCAANAIGFSNVEFRFPTGCQANGLLFDGVNLESVASSCPFTSFDRPTQPPDFLQILNAAYSLQPAMTDQKRQTGYRFQVQLRKPDLLNGQQGLG